MENNNNLMREQFNIVKNLRSSILEIFDEISGNITMINKVYVDVVKAHHHKEYLFGLDSFHFQNKMIEMEYENMRKVFHCIDNLMYCEYYKLYKTIHDYVVNDIKYNKIIEKLLHNNYPVYKDLEPHKSYPFEIIEEMYSSIIDIIKDLYEYLNIKNSKMITDKEQINLGLNIDNIVNSQNFTNILLNERITMYLKYLEVINKHHTKYMSRLITKCKLMVDICNQDIQIKQLNNKTNKTNTVETMDIEKETDTKKKENTNVTDNTIVDNTIVDNTIVDNTILDNTIIDNTIIDNSIIDNSIIDNSIIDTNNNNIKIEIENKEI